MLAMQDCTIQLDGVFDRPAALRVEEAFRCVKPGGQLHLDLTRVREFHDVALAVLARIIAAASGQRIRLDVSGLRRRDERMLGYLGIGLLQGRLVPEKTLG